jgi:NAD(P)-dependent dehydrogenase (short-subunit alcohol dehydrogenase family)
MSNPLEFGGRVVLIAGESGETGKHIAEAFLTAGATVVHCALLQPGHLPEAAGRKASFIAMDGGDAEQIAAVIDAVTAGYGSIDVLVSITGGPNTDAGSSADPADSDIRRGLITPLHFNQAANRQMQQQEGGGSIINISCDDKPVTTTQPGVLAAAHAGLANLGASLAVEWAPRVRVNTITVLLTQTEQPGTTAHSDQGVIGGSTGPIPGPTGQLPGIGNTCLFLASSLGSYISGTHVNATEM